MRHLWDGDFRTNSQGSAMLYEVSDKDDVFLGTVRVENQEDAERAAAERFGDAACFVDRI
jgi:hypothetical protein